MPERPNVLIAATMADAREVKRMFTGLSSWHVMTPRNNAERGWLYANYVWTPEAQELPAQKKWDLRMRLGAAIDEQSDELDFPIELMT